MGSYLDGCACRPAQPSLLVCRPAGVAPRRAFEIPGHLLLVTGWRLGLLTGGKTARTNREEAWTSYRGQDCENKQDKGLDIIQGARLREQPGWRLGHHTGGNAARTNRVETGTFHRGLVCEKCQGILSIWMAPLEVVLPCRPSGKASFLVPGIEPACPGRKMQSVQGSASHPE